MPPYYNYVTMHDIHNRLTNRGRNWSGDYYEQMFNCLRENRDRWENISPVLSQAIAELIWERDKKPYYSVHPSLVSKLCQIDFSKVPSDMITMPEPFDVICIRLKEENELLSIERGKYFLRSMLVWKRQKNKAVKYKNETFDIDDNVLIVWFDFGEIDPMNNPLYTYKCFPINPKKTIEETFNQFPPSAEITLGVQVSEEFARNCIKLFISVGFLASSESPLVIFDILSKDIDKWGKADILERNKMIEKAKNKGKNGWLLGTDQMFQSRELKYSHIRAGHPHLYWYGPGKKQLKLRFVAPTTVRKDKPFKPER